MRSATPTRRRPGTCAASSRARRRRRADVDRSALIVVDVQQGFDDPGWGPRNNPGSEANVAKLIEAWRERGQPIVYVRHDSDEPGSPFTPGQPGNDFQGILDGEPDLLVVKSVNSAFHGEPDLAQ